MTFFHGSYSYCMPTTLFNILKVSNNQVIAFSKAAKEAELTDVSDAAPEGAKKAAGIDVISTSPNAQFASGIVVPPVLETASTLAFLCMNMLLDKSRTINIVDYGVAQVEASNPNNMTGGNRTLGYMDPEKMQHVQFWHMLWEIYYCDNSYSDLSFSEVTSVVVRQNLRPEIPRCCPSSLANVMKRCWDANPNNRPKMHE
ncbi:hypothetical protein CQW23_13881 [Capsicum baccatum]|uniref:Serine-threonine/tyrosine-protein kinase catalytic domain-containing protein n=1 Tax=Capsicum baccatum TaxID=33114 RepID=A0A2G2WHL6_CAPBA|nr:hypothetical protein CQW23_13881 [Capsicum baccatum]